MASQSDDPGGDRNQDCPLRSPVSSLRGKADWHHSTRIVGSHVVLDECRSGESNARFQDLLQPPSHPSLTERRRIRPCHPRRQSVLVSLATTLSRPISETHGCLSFQRCALPAICWSPRAKTRNEIIRVGVLQFFIAAFREFSRFTASVSIRQPHVGSLHENKSTKYALAFPQPRAIMSQCYAPPRA